MIAETWLFATVDNPVPARPLTDESVPAEVCLTPADVRITWRGDGRFFATCSRASTGKPVLPQELALTHCPAQEERANICNHDEQ